jgi:hypothetical protein
MAKSPVRARRAEAVGARPPWLVGGAVGLIGLLVIAWLGVHRPQTPTNRSASPEAAADIDVASITTITADAGRPPPAKVETGQAAARTIPAAPSPASSDMTPPSSPAPAAFDPTRPVWPYAAAPSLVVDLSAPPAAKAEAPANETAWAGETGAPARSSTPSETSNAEK